MKQIILFLVVFSLPIFVYSQNNVTIRGGEILINYSDPQTDQRFYTNFSFDGNQFSAGGVIGMPNNASLIKVPSGEIDRTTNVISGQFGRANVVIGENDYQEMVLANAVNTANTFYNFNYRVSLPKFYSTQKTYTTRVPFTMNGRMACYRSYSENVSDLCNTVLSGSGNVNLTFQRAAGILGRYRNNVYLSRAVFIFSAQ